MAYPENVVILGHNGFIGSHLSRYLEGECSLTVSGNSLPKVDLSTGCDVDALAKNITPDSVLIILAAVKRQFGDSLDVFMQNMEIIRNVAAMIEHKPPRRVIYFSSAAVYGEETENLDIDESTDLNPTSYYGIAKYSSECILRKVCKDSGVDSLVCLRPTLIYGPGDGGNTYGPAGFSAAARNGKKITLWGDGSELREFIYINDLCRVISALIEKSSVPEILNIASGQRYSFRDVVDHLTQRYPALEVESRARSKEKVDNAFDPGKLLDVLGRDFTFTSLHEGIEGILDAG